MLRGFSRGSIWNLFFCKIHSYLYDRLRCKKKSIEVIVANYNGVYAIPLPVLRLKAKTDSVVAKTFDSAFCCMNLYSPCLTLRDRYRSPASSSRQNSTEIGCHSACGYKSPCAVLIWQPAFVYVPENLYL